MSKTTMGYLAFHWGDVYMLSTMAGKYTARAKFGGHEVLEADTPEQLLSMIRRHYPGSTRADLCST